MEDGPFISLDEQTAAVEREIKYRERVYPRWIESGKITKALAAHQLAAMRAVLVTVTKARDAGRLI